MEFTFNINVYSDALVVLGAAGIVVPILHRLGVNAVLAYLGAGAVLGPLGLGSFIKSFPFLYWVTIVDAGNVAGVAELGVVFLLFMIGLELSLTRLLTMRRLVFGMGGLQVVATTLLAAGALILAGQNPGAAVIVGASLSLSSTAIVLELLSEQGRLTTGTGRASFSVLLAQDLAVIPVLVFVSVLSQGTSHSVIGGLVAALVQAAIAVTVLVLFGRLLLRPLFQLVAGTGSTELFVAAVLFVIVSTAVVAHEAGLSMALGAFIAGVMLAETEYRKSIEATIKPFKGLLLGIFFFTVGMSIDVRVLIGAPLWLPAAALGLIVAKSLVLIGLGSLFRLGWPASIETALLLGPGGEFAFVIVGMASAAALIDAPLSGFTLAVTSLTMVLTPLLSIAGRRLARVGTTRRTAPELNVLPPVGKHAIVVGHGRVGKVVGALLRQHRIEYIAVDSDASSVARDRRDGFPVYYGTAADPAFLEACGLGQTTGVIITTGPGMSSTRW